MPFRYARNCKAVIMKLKPTCLQTVCIHTEDGSSIPSRSETRTKHTSTKQNPSCQRCFQDISKILFQCIHSNLKASLVWTVKCSNARISDLFKEVTSTDRTCSFFQLHLFPTSFQIYLVKSWIRGFWNIKEYLTERPGSPRPLLLGPVVTAHLGTAWKWKTIQVIYRPIDAIPLIFYDPIWIILLYRS